MPTQAPTIPVPAPASPGRRWPTSTKGKWGLRLLLAAPFIALTIWTYVGGYRASGNQTLVHQARQIPWGSSQLQFVPHAYPPLPILLAEIAPSPVVLGLVGAIAAGVILESAGFHLARRHFPPLLVGLLIVSLGASASFAYTAATDLPSLLALALLAVSLKGFLDFVVRGRTHGGFTAGLAIGLAGLCQPFVLVCASGFALAAPLVAFKQFKGQRAAARATAAVLLFPTIAGVAAWTFVNWRFTGSPFSWLHYAAPAIWHDHLTGADLSLVWTTLRPALISTPMFALAVVLLGVRRYWYTGLTILVPPIEVALALWLGFPVPTAVVAALLGVVALVALPSRPGRLVQFGIGAVAVATLVITWTAHASSAVSGWEQALR